MYGYEVVLLSKWIEKKREGGEDLKIESIFTKINLVNHKWKSRAWKIDGKVKIDENLKFEKHMKWD